MPSDIETIDTTLVTQSLQKVAKGAGIVFIGTIIGTLLGFFQRVLIARYFTQAEYGIFSLALVIFNIFAIIATLGLQEGTTRQIAYYRGKKDNKKVRSIIISSIQIALIASIIFSLLLFFSSNFLSLKIFHEKRLIITLKILSIALPFFVLINIFTTIARGFDDVKPKVYFQDILKNTVFIAFLIVIILFNLSFLEVIYAFSLSIIISCFLLAVYIMKKILLSVERGRYATFLSMGKELLIFSLPLIITAMLNMIIAWTDTLMLGYFKTSDLVGLYNAALPVSRFIPIILTSVVFVYTPIVSQLYSQKRFTLLKKNYATLTKWIFAATLPLFLVFFLFPGIILKFLFSAQYAKADVALQILSLGFFIHTFLGPNGATLTAIGKTKILMWAALLSSILNVLLNIVLIPSMGIAGAAIASASSLGLANIMLSVKLYQITEIHPFTKNYLKPIVVSVITVLIIYIAAHNFLVISFWMLPLLFILFLVMYSLALLFTKSFDPEDIIMLLEIEKGTNLDFSPIKKLLKRFI